MEAEAPLAGSFRSCLLLPISCGSEWGQDAGLGDRPHLPDPFLHLRFLQLYVEDGGRPGAATQRGAGASPAAGQGGSWGWARSQLRLRAYLSMLPAKEELSWGRGGRGGE